MHSTSIKLLLVAGARPNFMKIAPLIHAIERHNAGAVNGVPRFDWRLVHTGQHYDAKMSDVFFAELGVPAPDFCLDVGSGSHAVQTARVMERFEPVLLNAFAQPPRSRAAIADPAPGVSASPAQDFRPHWVIVVGDVNSTVGCALVASKLGVKIAHVEAGLRSYDRGMPEEINRIVTDALADLLLTPSPDADQNLRREGIPAEKICLVGNIMIDSLIANLPKARASSVLQRLGLEPDRFAYVTLHRPSNVDHRENLTRIMAELARVGQSMSVVFPMHPRTRKMIADFGLGGDGLAGLKIVEPLGYHDSLCLTENARLLLTDSGGLQEESTYFSTPCLTLRPNTERPVTVSLGSNRLTDAQRLPSDLSDLLSKPRRFGTVPPLWEGKTAVRILDALARLQAV